MKTQLLDPRLPVVEPRPQILDAAGRLGYDGVELRFLEGDDALWARPELTGGGLRETRARLRDAGARGLLRGHALVLPRSPGARARDAPWTRPLRIAGAGGAAGGARHPRVRRPRAGGAGPRLDARARSRRRWQRLGEAAQPLGVEVWLESHGDFARARDTLRHPRAASARRPWACVWDPANAFELGEAPAEGLRRPRAARAPRAREGHRAPAGRRGGRTPGRRRFPGAASSRRERVLAVLQAAGYDRWVSFEWEKRWHPAIEEPEVALPHFIRWAAAAMRPRAVPAAPRQARARARPRPARRPGARRRGSMGRGGGAAGRRSPAPRGGARRPRGRHLRLRAVAERVPGRAARGPGRSPGAGSPRSISTSTSASSADHPASFRRFLRDRLFDHVPGGRVPRPGRRGARSRRGVRALRGAAARARAVARHPRHRRERAPGVHRSAVVRFRRPARRARGRAGRAVPPAAGERRRRSRAWRTCRAPRSRSPSRPDCASRRRWPSCPGPAKRAAIAAALDGPLTRGCPASILRRHPRATLFLDEASAGGPCV